MLNEVLKRAIDTFGQDKQLDMVIEEMAELAKEICKFKRGKNNRNEILEEIADVEIMLEQLKYMIKAEQASIDVVKNYKINRLAEKLDEHCERVI